MIPVGLTKRLPTVVVNVSIMDVGRNCSAFYHARWLRAHVLTLVLLHQTLESWYPSLASLSALRATR